MTTETLLDRLFWGCISFCIIGLLLMMINNQFIQAIGIMLWFIFGVISATMAALYDNWYDYLRRFTNRDLE